MLDDNLGNIISKQEVIMEIVFKKGTVKSKSAFKRQRSEGKGKNQINRQ